MQTMVEKARQALMSHRLEYVSTEEIRIILTTLRDPTEGMVDIGQSKGWYNILNYGEGNVCFDDDGAKEIWQAMIDQALTEGEDA